MMEKKNTSYQDDLAILRYDSWDGGQGFKTVEDVSILYRTSQFSP